MAEDDGGRLARFVVQGRERAPARGADAEDVKEIARDERAFQPGAFDPGGDLWRFRKGIGEHRGLANERFILLTREPLGRRVGRSLSLHREQLARVAHVVHAKDERVENREHDGHQPKAQCHR